jgi:glycosyltransferase involved in cell wall biosynthesis
VWQPSEYSPFGKRNVTVIGWSGSPTHYEDLMVIEPVLANLMRKYPHVWFARVGAYGNDLRRTPRGFVPDDVLKELPSDRRINFMFDNHTHTIGQKYYPIIDIGVAPLVYNAFNSSKSSVKILEYSAASIPSVATRIQAYEPHEDHALLIPENDLAGWSNALEKLIVDVDYRRRLGEHAKACVMARHSIAVNVHKWADLIIELVGTARANQKPSAPVPATGAPAAPVGGG